MRMRKKKNLLPRMERCAALQIKDPIARRGHWRELMPEARELRVELGCGKGRFTVGHRRGGARRAVHRGGEGARRDGRRHGALRRRRQSCTTSSSSTRTRTILPEFFAPGEVDRIYINFCDPWPTKRHAKRRLTHGNFLKLYRKVLKDSGQIHFKTDNAPLFAWSVEEIPQFGFTLSEVTDDLHANGAVGVMTDYEAKFHELGTPIHRLVATMTPWEEPEEE